MIGRTHLTHLVDTGAIGAAEHLIEVAQKKLDEAIAQRNQARADIRKYRDEIDRRKAQLRAAHGRM